MKFTNRELIDLLKAWMAISLAFAILLKGNLGFFNSLILSAMTVGTGFLLHELGHKLIATRYGCKAEFKSFDFMLVIAVLLSFTGFIFAAPGAVFISGYINKERNGKISAAGPTVNIILAAIFFILLNLNLGDFLNNIGSYGFRVNTWLALFNLIPVWNLDGSKVLKWNKKAYFSLAIIVIILTFL